MVSNEKMLLQFMNDPVPPVRRYYPINTMQPHLDCTISHEDEGVLASAIREAMDLQSF
jgi:hypothetical protein